MKKILDIAFWTMSCCLNLFSQAITIDPLKLLNYELVLVFTKQEKAEHYKKYLEKLNIRADLKEIIKKENFQTITEYHVTPQAQVSYSSFITQEVIQDLNLTHIVHHLPTLTTIGPWGLQFLLFHPLTSLTDLKARQDALTYLCQDLLLKEKIISLLRSVPIRELLIFWDPRHKIHEETKQFFFSDFFNHTFRSWLKKYAHIATKSFNGNTQALSLTNNMVLAWQIIDILKNTFISNVIIETVASGIDRHTPSYMESLKLQLLAPMRRHNPQLGLYANGFKNTVNGFFDNYKMTGGDMYLYAEHKLPNHLNHHVRKALSGLAVIGYIGWLDYIGYATIALRIKTSRAMATSLNNLQALLVHINNFLKQSRHLAHELHDYSAVSNLPGIQELYTVLVIQEKNSAKLNQLFELLESETFAQESLNYSRGIVLKTYKLLCSIKHELIPLLQAIALLDATVSIASHYKTHTSWCFPEFIDSSKAYIDLINFFNPLIPEERIVTNTLTMGYDKPQHAIFTGPHGGGKSTSSQAIAWSILCAQSWGIVPAQKARMSVFTGIRTYATPQAQLALGMSTFMAEKTLLNSIIHELKNLKPHEKMFVFFDEPLRGTLEREAENRIFSMGLELAHNKKCCSIITTHSEKPTTLAQTTDNFANYHMELLENNNGFVRTFKLIPGIADWWFNDDTKRALFIDTGL